MTDLDTALENASRAVEAASRRWIEAFNRGDAEACACGYTENASMQGRPLADITGREAIEQFWRGVLEQDPGNLVYEDTRVHALNESTAVLSARWSMSRLGSGIITLERWEKQADGRWLLAEDIFEISEQKAS
ncbi:MAG: SgcJ/EcaC family oxidoreductase [Holophagales bacterium]|nr:SgcJ/EcaC family oxidoreductase [Holophagales bacterium]